MFVNAKKQKNRIPTIAEGIAILKDFDKTIKTAKPANIQNIAVLVPDANMLLITRTPITKKKILSILILEVIPKTRNATAAAAALQP